MNSIEASPRWFLVTSRQKNLDTVADLALTMSDIQGELLDLSENDYCEGPLKDQHLPGHVWVFGRTIRGREVYIKLRLSGDEKSPNVAVLSLHCAEWPLRYPFRT